ncbi:hypothetical protein T4D_17004, partial [Trichinella pseudospiralis]
MFNISISFNLVLQKRIVWQHVLKLASFDVDAACVLLPVCFNLTNLTKCHLLASTSVALLRKML